MRVLVLACALVAVASALTQPPKTLVPGNGLGDGMWRTFSDALNGDAPALPLTTSDVSGWTAQNNGQCDPSKGILYTQDASGLSKDHPLGVYMTSGGQVAGLAVQIYGESWTSGIGPAAQPSLVKDGFWISTGNDMWMLSVSFRDASMMCDGSTSQLTVGDRVVINQGTLDWYLPATAKEAKAQLWQPGSCMKTMGQHWFLDLEDAPRMSWKADTVLPVVAMYWPPDMTGKLQTIFFTTPVTQKGSVMLGHADWETPMLPASAMCQNWCNSECHWDTDFWSTMHIYFSSGWKTWTCPNAETSGLGSLVGRSCPSGQQGTYKYTWTSAAEDKVKEWGKDLAADIGLEGKAASGSVTASNNNGNGNDAVATAAVAVAVVALVVAVVATVLAVRARRDHRDVLLSSRPEAPREMA